MKKWIRLSLCLACAACSSAPAAELLWQDFDSVPTGSIANATGWSRADWLGGITARVDNVGACISPSNILQLYRHATASSAVFTNFDSVYTTNEHPVIRCSAKLVAPTNVFFQLGLCNSSNGAFLSFQSTNGYGGLGFLAHARILFPLVGNRFADLAFFYNRSNNSYRLDYDYTNRIPWITNSEGGATVARFDQFVVARPGFSTSTVPLLVDDVSVETFPPHVWAWWRCAAEPQARFVEQLGTFPPVLRASHADDARAGSSDPVWDGRGDVHNAGATRQLAAGPASCAIAIPASTNWTVEAVFRMPSTAQDMAFLDWGRDVGSTATGAWISVGYNANGYVNLDLRDAQQADATYASLALRHFTPNGRWQHMAVVKSNATVTLYVDYQFVTNRVLTGPADGSYAFGAGSRVAIGKTLAGSNPCDADTLIDEMRVSGKALALAEFLQPGQPLIADIDDLPADSTWALTLKGIRGKSYRVETSPTLGSDARWQFATNRVAAYTFDFIDVPGTGSKTHFVRVIRED